MLQPIVDNKIENEKPQPGVKECRVMLKKKRFHSGDPVSYTRLQKPDKTADGMESIYDDAQTSY